jgi:hypothetical protein
MLKMDFLKNLPQVEETPTNSDLEIINFLVDESKKLKNSINIKQVVVATCIFIVLVLPVTDSLIKNNISDNTSVQIFVKVLVFCVAIICIQMIVN